jgi:Lrp/AsnC family transcriptional regulator for asnA, asnC and gidA
MNPSLLTKIDKVDCEIILQLIDNARKPFTEIAKDLLVSTGTVHQRVKKLERAGVINGYSLSINYQKFGYSLTVYVGVFVQTGYSALKVVDKLHAIPEVTVADLAAGVYSLFCKLRCRDTLHAKDVIFAMQAVEGVKGTETMIMLEERLNDNKRLLRSIIKSMREQF